MDPFAIKVPLWTPEPEFNLTTASVKGNPKASEEDITKNLPKVTQLHQPGPGLELREPQDSGCLAAGSFCQKLINQIVHHRIPPPGVSQQTICANPAPEDHASPSTL
jgi:hypothetical protein